MARTQTFSISQKSAHTPPRLPYAGMKKAVLGRAYELSLAFIDRKTSRRLNRAHRGKNKPANVLSFPLSRTSGEILIDIAQATKDAPLFRMSARAFIARLFIHASLHLKGMEHGSTMERKERAYCARFGVRI